MKFAVHGLYVGQPETMLFRGKEVVSAIRKSAVHSPVKLNLLNLVGDLQGEPSVHGGADKAVHIYPYDHYRFWRERLGAAIEPAAFGENVSLAGAIESTIQIGDIFRAGSAIVQVSEPRQPCYKLAMLHGQAKLPLWMKETGFSGYYLRVLEEGILEPAGYWTLEDRERSGVSVLDAFNARYDTGDSWRSLVEQVLEGGGSLGSDWRNTLEKRLRKTVKRS
ncbi:MOSC domain-containing protein [Paenibacillus solisilvae]|uniref:MOSC domain-containing protein n=1 Tax=Paenibacillus solisilvae TaxID=2486751 RepID=A0ABW0VWH1_9BACL